MIKVMIEFLIIFAVVLPFVKLAIICLNATEGELSILAPAVCRVSR